MIHELKCWPDYFAPVAEERKKAELRKDDRGFVEGDLLWLREWSEGAGYTGREALCQIMHIVRGGPWLNDGYAMLSLDLIKVGAGARMISAELIEYTARRDANR